MSKGPMIEGEFRALSARRINEETCKVLDYKVGRSKSGTVQLAVYYDKDGQPCAQKVRGPDKKFYWTGSPNDALLYGQTKWGAGRGAGGNNKRVIITEGEIDALSVSQALGNKWPVVSVPNGADAAPKDCAKQLEWLDSFEEIVIFFDQDEPGRKASIAVAELFALGKARIVNGFKYKDANDALKAGEAALIVQAQWNAKPYWPDDIIAGDDEDLWKEIETSDTEPDFHYPWKGLDALTRGIRKGEVVLFAAGTGVGKSQTLREITHAMLSDIRARGEKLGLICLEENARRTALGLMSLELDVPLHKTREGVSQERLRSAFESAMKDVLILRHWGSLDSARLFSKMRSMVAAGCSTLVLDHVSIVVSGSDEAENEGGERRVLDKLMTRMRSLVEELGIACLVVSHLRKASGKPHEEGGQVSLDDLRGSGSLKQVPDIIIAYERDQQAKDANVRAVTLVRLLKNRPFGDTGVATWIKWNGETGRYTELDSDPFETMGDDACPSTPNTDEF